MNNDRSRARGRDRSYDPGPLRTRLWPIVCAALLALAARPAGAVDFGDWAQRMKQHEHWTSVEFRDPYSGKFLASRAGTEDRRVKATLTLTAHPADGCIPEVVIVFERGADGGGDTEKSDLLELQFDRLRPTKMPIRIVREQGDPFEFVQFAAPLDPKSLAGHRVLRLRAPPELRAEFSLRGFTAAWRTARSVCEDFSPGDGDDSAPAIPVPESDEIQDI